jgi:hypothetical protein
VKKKFKVQGSKFRIESSAKILPQPKSSLNKSIFFRTGAFRLRNAWKASRAHGAGQQDRRDAGEKDAVKGASTLMDAIGGPSLTSLPRSGLLGAGLSG